MQATARLSSGLMAGCRLWSVCCVGTKARPSKPLSKLSMGTTLSCGDGIARLSGSPVAITKAPVERFGPPRMVSD